MASSLPNWYYTRDGHQVGPISESEIPYLINSGVVVASTLVWREGMTDWLPANQSTLSNLVSASTPPPLPAGVPRSTPIADIEEINSLFKKWWIHLAWGAPCLVIVVGIGGLIASVVFGTMLFYKLWTLIPPDRAATTPAKAVGFSFIPFFGYYWIFISEYGLAKSLNRELAPTRHSSKVNEGLCLTHCILTCCGIIPYVNLLLLIPNAVISVILIIQFKNAGIAVIESRAVNTPRPAPQTKHFVM
ncbi:MAG: DUF4339 domain-containing protein [Dehalococcoidia bacterium]|nr:DUF4339 domain-containing protein [Dehalococcoidia bacterium]